MLLHKNIKYIPNYTVCSFHNTRPEDSKHTVSRLLKISRETKDYNYSPMVSSLVTMLQMKFRRKAKVMKLKEYPEIKIEIQ